MTVIFSEPPVADPGEGSTLDRVLGTGNAFSAFPGYLQFNGLLLNYSDQFDYYHVNNVDGLDDAEVRDNRVLNPNEDGETAFGTYYGGRPIVINGEIRAYHLHKADDMREALQRAFLRTQVELPLWLRTGDVDKDRLVYCKRNAKLEIPLQQPEGDLPRVPYMIPLRASNPRILSYLLHSSGRTGAGTLTAENKGNMDAQTKIRFVGPATTMTLTVSSSLGDRIVTVGPIDAGDYLEVDSSGAGVRIKDQLDANQWGLYDSSSDKIVLAPNEVNDIDLAGTGLSGASEVLVQWRDAWSGI